ncbi:MAG: glycine reductase, partial [Clostridiales bacterium]|nr:glycine reductase [Clostridiales bacterium]
MNSVIKGTAYILAHGPDMVIHNGTTQTTERIVNPSSQYLIDLPSHIRSFEDAAAYAPNQTYIGTITPEELSSLPMPWYENSTVKEGNRFGKLGEIIPQDEFYLLIQACDVFDLVWLDKAFVAEVKPRFTTHPLMDETIIERIKEGIDQKEISRLVAEEDAEGLYQNNV